MNNAMAKSLWIFSPMELSLRQEKVVSQQYWIWSKSSIWMILQAQKNHPKA